MRYVAQLQILCSAALLTVISTQDHAHAIGRDSHRAPPDSDTAACYSCLVHPANCSPYEACEFCNSTEDCSRGSCIPHPALGILEGVCENLGAGRVFGFDYEGERLGRIISFCLLALFLSLITLICCRLLSNVFSWRKCCICECSITFQCCCEPKIPDIRVTPTSALPQVPIWTTQRLSGNTAQRYPSPPPSYTQLYPQSYSRSSPVNLEPEVDLPPPPVPAIFNRAEGGGEGAGDWTPTHAQQSSTESSHEASESMEAIVIQAQRMFTVATRNSNLQRFGARPYTC